MRAKRLFLLGVLVALVLSVIVTIPYVVALWSLGLRSREMNAAAVAGETHMYYQPDSLVNITLVSVYPKAAVEGWSNMFVVHFIFFINLDANVTEFECDELEVHFRSLNWTSGSPTYFGLKTLSSSDRTLESLSRYSASGRMQPFVANVSVNIKGNKQGFSGMLQLAGEIETFPNSRLGGRITTTNNSWGFWNVLFDMEKYSTTIYRFNYLPLWFAYGISLGVVGLASLCAYAQHADEEGKKRQNSSVIPA